MKILMLNRIGHNVWLRNELDILKTIGEVTVISANSIFGYLKKCHKALGYDIYFSRAGTSLHTILFSKMFGGKSVIVAGGSDSIGFKEWDYGTFQFPKNMITKWVFNHADMVLPVSDRVKDCVLWQSNPKRIKRIYNGLDTEKFKPKGQKKDMVLLVSGLNPRHWMMKMKGLETFVKCAQHYPDVPFILAGEIGTEEDVKHIKSLAPKNVMLTGLIPQDELIGYYQQAKVYTHLSFHESFCFALAEAMSCGCIPIATNRGALPEIGGEIAEYVRYGNVEETCGAIDTALNQSSRVGRMARNRIVVNFSLEKRKEALTEAILELGSV
jgi:glycosyltransferase involved in cell wall biosynthesis